MTMISINILSEVAAQMSIPEVVWRVVPILEYIIKRFKGQYIGAIGAQFLASDEGDLVRSEIDWFRLSHRMADSVLFLGLLLVNAIFGGLVDGFLLVSGSTPNLAILVEYLP